MSLEINSLSGFLGMSPESITMTWLQTEVISKARAGDVSSVYKLQMVARHCADSTLKTYAFNVLKEFNLVDLVSIELIGLSTVAALATITLAVDYTPQNATTRTITWTSSDETKATVSSLGVVTGVAEGTATITATSSVDGVVAATKVITVTA